ncbi:transcription elongation factor TFIIS-like [Nymphaea colorata]|nr:transcription elongation factor TFIIS-like [Nymphaea colorata]
MAGKSAERELVSLFDEAKKAADLAASGGGSVDANEVRCLDALRLLQEFPVNMSILVSTQVGKRLRGLTKHPRKKIQSKASELIELWKNVVMEETARNNRKSSSSLSSEGESSVKSGNKAEKVEVVKLKNDKAEKTTSSVEAMRDEKLLKPQISKVEKLERPENVKVVKVAKEDKGLVNDKKPASSSVIPPKLSAMVKCNDPVRDKLRELLAEAFTKVASEAEDDTIDEVNKCDPIRVAVTVESVMFEKLGRSNGAQKFKYRSVMFNLKDANNPDLRRKVLLGEVKPEKLITMTPEEMASERRKQENKQIKEKALFDCQRGGPAKATTDQFKCGRCGQRKTTYYQLQTRSADEPMTTFVTCVNCNNHWKFC